MDDDTFRELAALAYRTAFRITGSRGDAEDVAQETMAKTLVRWSRVADHARPWVCRVAANGAIGVLRRRLRPGAPDGERRGPGPDAGDVVLDRIDLQRTLLALPRRQRDVLVLRYLLDLPEAAVAHELGISLGTVKTHAHRGLSSLRSSLTDRPDTTPQVQP